jgi:ATP-dependent helicase/DNAse subunit B
LLARYQSALREVGPAMQRSLWIAPTARAATAVREQLVAGGVSACLAPGVMTFDGLTDVVLREAGARLWPLSDFQQREILRRLVERALEAGKLESFAATARSAGFADLMLEHVRELKRRGIEPEMIARSPGRRARTDEHQALAQLYAEYQRLLAERKLADREGRHWIARDFLAAGSCPSLAQLGLVVVDGFTDFTPTQHDVLALLAKRAHELVISLPMDCKAPRLDLFAKSAATLAELEQRHPRLELRRHEARPSGWPAFDFLSENLFGNPRQFASPPAGMIESLDRFEIVAASGEQDEIVQLARRIKRRLICGDARPGDIAVVFRSLHRAASRLEEVFNEFGIPFEIESEKRLIDSPAIDSLLGVLRLADEDWPFRRLVAVITNNSLVALGNQSRVSAEWLVRELQIAQGRDELIRRIETLAESAAAGDHLSQYSQHRAAAAVTALPVLRRLAAAFDELPTTATLFEWPQALARLGTQLGLQPVVDAVEDPSSADTMNEDACDIKDLNAWQAIVRHFRSLANLETELGESPRMRSQREMLQLLVDVATHEAVSRTRDEMGRVLVLNAASARTIPIKHLYLAGMSEQAFPLPEPAGRLYSEADYRWFQRFAGNSSGHKARHSAAFPVGEGESGLARPQEEMLLFYEVLTRAQESITISFAALDERAQAIPPSPYVAEIERLIGAENVARRRAAPQLAPVANDQPPLSPADWRLQATASALEGDCALLAGLISAQQSVVPASAIDAGLRVVHARARREGFGRCEGVLNSPAAVERLARRFGPQHLWSPSQWEQYAACPYKFYLSVVLGLEPLGELTLQTDFRRRGGLLHNVFARFHREGSFPAGALHDKDRFFARMRETLDLEVSATSKSGIDGALAELDRRQVAKWGEKHFDHLAAYDCIAGGLDQPLSPTHFELRFGPARPGDASADDPGSLDNVFELDIGGEKVRVTGRIDRIDVGQVAGRTVFSVIDYKTGRMTSLKEEHIVSGERLQLPVYVAAAQALLFNNEATPIAAGYWTMDRGFDKRGALNMLQELAVEDANGDRWNELLSQAVERIKQFVGGIRQGEFPVISRDEHCTGRCEFSTVCRVAQVRALGKTWPSIDG